VPRIKYVIPLLVHAINISNFEQNTVKIEVTTPQPTRTREVGKKWMTAHLPAVCSINGRWRKRFVPTYIWFVARGDNPWAVEDAIAVSALKKIWTKIYTNEKFSITSDGPVFAVVSSFYFFYMRRSGYIHPQAQQRVSDTWRSVIGSTAIAIVNTFFESNKDLESDEDCRAFAAEGLNDLKFLYSNTESDDPRVS
jgi:hypothetical protein